MLRERLLDKAIKEVYNDIKKDGQVIFVPTFITVSDEGKISTIGMTGGEVMATYNKMLDKENSLVISDLSKTQMIDRLAEFLPSHAILDIIHSKLDDETLMRMYTEILNELEGEE